MGETSEVLTLAGQEAQLPLPEPSPFRCAASHALVRGFGKGQACFGCSGGRLERCALRAVIDTPLSFLPPCSRGAAADAAAGGARGAGGAAGEELEDLLRLADELAEKMAPGERGRLCGAADKCFPGLARVLRAGID